MSTRPLAECPSPAARKRHKRNNETCNTCDQAKRKPTPRHAPCGTPAARRRHRGKNETCDTCGPVDLTPVPHPCGTYAAYRRHTKKGQQPCDPCTVAYRAHDEARRRARGIPARNHISIDDLITEVRFLIHAGEGEHRILEATGYTNRPHSLRARLTKAGHQDLTNAIFNQWDLAA
jgi:hypothetical protein